MSSTKISVAVAVSPEYTLPLEVMVASMAANLRPGAEVDLYLLEDGVPVAERRRLEQAWQSMPVRAHWITPDKSLLMDRVSLGGYAGVPATYFRILAAELLPPHLSRIIYLDIDLLVLGDLTELWLHPFDGHAVLAVQLRPSLAVSLDARPPECKINEDTPAFNAGVLVIDLEAWRREELGGRTLDFAERYRERFRSWDQDALNCALIGRWGRLPLAWNYRPEAIVLPAWRPSGYTAEEALDAAREPKIVHFAGSEKPWDSVGDHPWSEEYFAYVDRSSWSGWRPPRPNPAVRLRLRLVENPHRKLRRLMEIAVKTRRAGTSFRPFFPYLLRTVARYPWTLVTYPLSAGNHLKRWLRSAGPGL